MALNVDTNFPPSGPAPYRIDPGWCIGDSLTIINNNSFNFDNRLENLDTRATAISAGVDTKVSKSGDTMTGALNINNNLQVRDIVQVGGSSGSAIFVQDRNLNATQGAFYRQSNINRLWDQAAGDVISYNSSGNVGIGTTAPTQRLEVNGNIRASGVIISTDYVNGTYFNAGGNTPNIGRAELFQGTSTAPGYVAWYRPDGTTRIGYMGWNPGGANDLSIHLQNGATLKTFEGQMIVHPPGFANGTILKPTDWGGGLSTWDVYATGSIGSGPSNGPVRAYINRDGDIGAGRDIYHRGIRLQNTIVKTQIYRPNVTSLFKSFLPGVVGTHINVLPEPLTNYPNLVGGTGTIPSEGIDLMQGNGQPFPGNYTLAGTNTLLRFHFRYHWGIYNSGAILHWQFRVNNVLMDKGTTGQSSESDQSYEFWYQSNQAAGQNLTWQLLGRSYGGSNRGKMHYLYYDNGTATVGTYIQPIITVQEYNNV